MFLTCANYAYNRRRHLTWKYPRQAGVTKPMKKLYLIAAAMLASCGPFAAFGVTVTFESDSATSSNPTTSLSSSDESEANRPVAEADGFVLGSASVPTHSGADAPFTFNNTGSLNTARLLSHGDLAAQWHGAGGRGT